jgi:nitrogen fixation NifU-like protein
MEYLAQIPLWMLLAAAGVLVVVVGAWVIVELLVNPTSTHVEEPDVISTLTGSCGDTMQIRLKVKNGTVTSASYWASGCGPSSACGAAATQLCIGIPVEDVPEQVHAEVIEKAVGGLPEDHLHCAELAAETLQEAVHRYLLQTTRAR